MDERRRSRRPTWVILLAGLPGFGLSAGEGAPRGKESGGASPLSRLPLVFVENAGQWATPAKFVARRGGMVARMEKDAILLQLTRRDEGDRLEGVVVRLAFEGTLETVALEGESRQPGLHNFFLGNDPSKWRTGVPGFASVRFRGLQEGVDLRVREEGGRLEYDLILAPGADLDRVVVRCEGTVAIRVEPDGSLSMKTALAPLRQSPPVAWETLAGGERREVEARFHVLGPDRFGFEVPGRDPSLPLVVDPALLYSTYLGGAAADSPYALAVDASGAATVAGQTSSSDFPTTAGAYGSSPGGGGDAFVARLSPSGGSLLYSTFLGGTVDEAAFALALDASGAATVTGWTTSPDFPTTAGAYDTSHDGAGGFPADVFVTRISPTGGGLLYSTFLGGNSGETAYSLALDASASAIVAGLTTGSDFPTTTGAYDTSYNGGTADVVVARLSASGGSLVYSTFLGGLDSDVPSALALDASGSATVGGWTLSLDFPTTTGAYDTGFNSVPGFFSADAFVARLSPSGGSLLYSTFLGGTENDAAYALALDPSGAATVAGETSSGGPFLPLPFPVTPGAFDTIFNGDRDAFVTRFSPSGGDLLFSTFLGSGGFDAAWAIALGPCGGTTVAGRAGWGNFPTSPGAYDTTFDGGGGFVPGDGFVARISPSGGSLLYSSFLGGTGDDSLRALAVDKPSGAATVCGWTESTAFPVTPGAYDTSFSGPPTDGFLSRLHILPPGASVYGTSSPGCAGPLAIGVSSCAQVGNASFAIPCENAPPNSTGLLGLSALALNPPALILWTVVWIDVTSLLPLPAASDATGAAEVPIPIPSDPGLVGGQVFAQFFWPDPCGLAGFSSSNALSVTVQA